MNYKEIDKKIRRVLKCKRETTLLVETIFHFFPEEAVFPYSGNVFFNKCFIPSSGNGFSGKYKPQLFFRRLEMYFFNESFISAIGEGFSLYWKLSTLLESSFQLVKTVTDMNENHFLKTDLNSCQWKLTFQLVETIPFHWLRYFSRSSLSQLVETHFPFQKKKYCFLLRTFFPASGNHYLKLQRSLFKTIITAIGNNLP